MEKLAIMGGLKKVTIQPPHYIWPDVSEKEIQAVEKYMRAGKNCEYGYPEIVEEFENRFKEYHKINYALALNSGTSSLHTAYFALGIGPGDEVIVPNFTFPATALPIFPLGGIPILCDCLKDTVNIDPKEIERKITKKTKAIAITHLWGHPCEMDEIMNISKKYNIPVLEDCAHSPGAKYKGKLVGTFGAVACFSFDNNKLLASGEAGVLITKSQEIFEKSMLFSDLGARIKKQIKLPRYKKFIETGLGLKYRIHPLAAVIANEKVKILDELNNGRVKTLNYFSNLLKETKSIIPPVNKEYVERGGFYGYKPVYNSESLDGLQISAFIKILQAEGVDVRQTVSPPLHKTELFSNSINYGVSTNTTYTLKENRYSPEDYPISEWFMKSHLSFPTFSKKIDKRIIDQYIEAIHKVEDIIINDLEMIKKISL